MVSKAGKLLLKNTIQSLEHQNKIREEKEMWNKWQNERNGSDDRKERLDRDVAKRKERDLDRNDHRSGSYEDKHKPMSKRCKTNDQKPDNYWLKKLMAEEEKLSNERWTHNGFKELYSQELDSQNSSSDSEQEIQKKSKKKKKKHKKHHKKHKSKRKK